MLRNKNPAEAGANLSSSVPDNKGDSNSSPAEKKLLLDFQTFKNSEKGAEFKQWIKSNFEKCKADRLTIQRQWDINLEMYGGRQWLQLIGNTLKTPVAPRHRVRATVNLTRPIVRIEIAKMTGQQPTAFVVPASGNDTDLFAAQGGESVWRSIVERKNFQTKVMIPVAFWTSITGNGFFKTVWNHQLVDPTLMVMDELTKTPIQAPAGDVDFGVVRPYNLFVPDLLCEDIEQQPYLFEAYTKPVVWAQQYFGKLLQNPVVPTPLAREEVTSSRFDRQDSATSAVPESVIIIECYIKPGAHKDFPQGGFATLVGDELAQVSQSYPFSHGEYPYSHIRHIPTGKFYGDSVLVDTNPLQREYNGTRSHIVESKRLMAKPQLLVPKGSMEIHKYTSEPGALITYLPGLGKPDPLPMQPLPAYVLQEQDRIKGDMEDISGQHQASRGQAPGSGITAATAIAFLQEKDDNLLSVTTDSIEAGVQKCARHTLVFIIENWDEPRIIRTIGPDQSFDAVELKGSQLSSDIRIETGSALPTSKPARQAFLMELFQSGAISSSMLLDLIDMGGVQKLTEQIRTDMRQAQRENLRMKKLTPDEIMSYNQQKVTELEQGAPESIGPNGMPMYDPAKPETFPPMIQVNDYDNHEVHVTTHDNYRKSQEFENLDPSVKSIFATHINMHKAYQQHLQQQQMMGLAPPPEQTPGQGTPPPGQDTSGQAPTNAPPTNTPPEGGIPTNGPA